MYSLTKHLATLIAKKFPGNSADPTALEYFNKLTKLLLRRIFDNSVWEDSEEHNGSEGRGVVERIDLQSICSTVGNLIPKGYRKYAKIHGSYLTLEYTKKSESDEFPVPNTKLPFTYIWNHYRRRKKSCSVVVSKEDFVYIMGVVEYIITEFISECFNSLTESRRRCIKYEDIKSVVLDEKEMRLIHMRIGFK